MSVLRRHLSRLAWCALYAFLCGLAVPLYESHPINAADDAACANGRAVLLSSAAPLIGAAASVGEGPGHCVVCHWLRTMGGAVVQDAVALGAPASPSVGGVTMFRSVLAATILTGESRAPPATSHL